MFSTLVLTDVASSARYPSMHLVLHRHEPRANKLPSYIDSLADLIAPPAQPASPGNLRLSLSLGKIIGSGAVSTVYEATINPSGSTSRLKERVLPPLAVKISRTGMASTLLPEAQNYVEMATLQGHVIPRCYGLYSAAIPSGIKFLPREEQAEDGNGGSSSGSYHSLPKEGRLLGPNVVSVLVMERLGDALPCGTLRSNTAELCVSCSTPSDRVLTFSISVLKYRLCIQTSAPSESSTTM